jgi:hypothetical protein
LEKTFIGRKPIQSEAEAWLGIYDVLPLGSFYQMKRKSLSRMLYSKEKFKM